MILRHTPFGVACAMIGSNLEATRYSAVDTRRVLVGVYVMSSVTCFFAALVMLATFNSASADYAQSYLLVTILAAVLGGVDPFGGFGTVSGLMLALAILQVISSGLNQFGLSQLPDRRHLGRHPDRRRGRPDRSGRTCPGAGGAR